jgi:hypothetical protein
MKWHPSHSKIKHRVKQNKNMQNKWRVKIGKWGEEQNKNNTNETQWQNIWAFNPAISR